MPAGSTSRGQIAGAPSPSEPAPTGEATALSDIVWPGPATLQCPYDYYARLRTEAPIYHPEGRNEYLVSRWQDVARILEDRETFIQPGSEGGIPNPENEPLTPETMAMTNRPEHTRKRSLGKELVAADRLRTFQTAAREICGDLIDAVIADGQMEFCREFAHVLPVRLVADALGLPREDNPDFLRWFLSSEPEQTAGMFMTEEQLVTERRQRGEALAYMRRAVEDRVQRPRDDFLSDFITRQIETDGEPSLGYLTAEADLLLFAGNVTTAHALGNMLLALLTHPEQLERVLADRALISGLVEESLRFEPPVQWLSRYVAADVEIGGVEIPRGALVHWMLAAANRDEDQFDAADEFRVDRPEVIKHNLAFGRGIHRCLGAPLARLELRIAMEEVLSRLEDLQLDASKPMPAPIGSLLFRGRQELHITFTPGSPRRHAVTDVPR